MKLYFYVSCFAVLFIEIRAQCFHSNILPNYVGLKLSSVPNGYVFENNKLTTIPDGKTFMFYCGSQFLLHDPKENESYGHIGKALKVECENGGKLLSTERHSYLPEAAYEMIITCNSDSALFYGIELDYCDYEGLRQMISVNSSQLVSFEVCYDLTKSEPIFVHYVATRSVYEKQPDYKTNIVSKHYLTYNNTLNMEEQIRPEIELGNDRTLFFPSAKQLLTAINYTYEELASSNLYTPLNVGSFQHKFNTPNSVPWWTPLRVGIWKDFENLLSNQLETESYDIYAGKSHKASYPENFVSNSKTSMLFEVEGQKKHIPLYIWNYVIPRNKVKGNDEFVLVGINSPFVESDGTNSLVICEDICDTIPWLQPLMATRKITSFGYVFCCKPKDVFALLDGFPRGKYASATN